MAKKTKILPKKQSRLSQDSIETYNNAQKQPTPDELKKNRAYNRSVKGDEVKQLTIGLKDIDETIFYYFEKVIKPSVVQNGVRIPVPILYGSPEKWAAVQKGGFYRDRNGKIQTPLIMFKRERIDKNRGLTNKLDANVPSNFMVFEKKFSKKNIYDRFSQLTNRKPVKELYGVIVPDFVNIEYSCVVFTEYVDQMNSIVESINFASDAYWGDPEKFRFKATIDSYTNVVEVNQGEDRVVKSSFLINMMGHLIPNTINTAVASPNKYYSKSAIKFGMEVAGTEEILNARALTPGSGVVGRTFYDGPKTRNVTIVTQTSGMTDEERTYLTTNKVIDTSNNTAVIDTGENTITFTNVIILSPPPGFPPLTKSDFKVIINGLVVEQEAIDSILQVGNDVVVDFNSTLNYTIEPGMEIAVVGKFEGDTDEFVVNEEGVTKVRVDNDGTLQLVSQSITPSPIEGGFFYSSSNSFYLGFKE